MKKKRVLGLKGKRRTTKPVGALVAGSRPTWPPERLLKSCYQEKMRKDIENKLPKRF